MPRKWIVRTAWMALGIAGLYGASALAGVVSGGPLDPPGPVGPTMKTLEDIPGTWSRQLSDSGPDSCNTARFTCVLGGGAVRDNETGLVWESTPFTELAAWSTAAVLCGDSLIGGRGGWRLPTDAEMRSLLDPNAASQPMLPDGHPFNVFGPFERVWTLSRVPVETDLAYAVDVDTLYRYAMPMGAQLKRWCVRDVQADAPVNSALAEEPPAWYQTLDATGGCFSERFRCVMNNGEAVLDRETGLVWQRAVSTEGTEWVGARHACATAETGGRTGWRLPDLVELFSLLAILPDDRREPAGSPFSGLPVDGDNLTHNFWTSNLTYSQGFAAAWYVPIGEDKGLPSFGLNVSYRRWCVRGAGASVHSEGQF